MKAAGDAGYLSESATARIYATGDLSMPTINDFVHENTGTLAFVLADEKDRRTVREIIETIYRRTARILTIFFNAFAQKAGFSKDKPVCLILDGSTYTKTPKLQTYLKEELLASKKLYGYAFAVSTPENPTLIGSALAAVMNR